MKKIREFAKLCDTTPKTLRFYDNAGVLKADYIDPVNGYRYYSEKQVEEYRKIMELKQVGFTLEEIRSHFGKSDNRRQQQFIMLYHLKQKKACLEEALENCEKLIQTCEERIDTPAGQQNIYRIDDRQEIILSNDERELTFTCRADGMDICCEVFTEMFSRPGNINLDMEDIIFPVNRERPILVQQIEGTADEILDMDVSQFFTEEDNLQEIRTAMFRFAAVSGVSQDDVDQLMKRLSGCFSEWAAILWSADFTAKDRESCKLQIVGIY